MDNPRIKFGLRLIALTISRLLLTTGLRMVYPFLPALSRGVGVSPGQLSQLISLRNLIGITSPAFSHFSDRFGYRRVASLTMLLFGVSVIPVLLSPTLWALSLSLIFMGLMKVIFDPAMQALVAESVRYKNRGKALAITELSWAGSFLFAVPIMGVMIERYGWQSPFIVLGAGAVILAAVLWRYLPRIKPAPSRGSTSFSKLASVCRLSSVRAALIYVFLIMAANDILLIIYGGWMESNFGLAIAAVGAASAVIGVAELFGEGLSGVLVDAIGKRPVVILAGTLTAAVYLVVPYVTASLVGSLVVLFVLFLLFETTVVGGIPLLTELSLTNRGAVMALVMAAGSLGRAAGAFAGPFIWSAGEMWASAASAAALTAIGVVILARWIREAPGAPAN